MEDWDPPLFREGGYPEFLAAQTAMVPVRLFRFAFRDNAIQRQVGGRKNLFIRGPSGSGRGLLAANIKRHALFCELSVTPIPNDYDILKGELGESERFGDVGDIAKAALNGKYESPDLTVIEHIRAEQKFRDSDGVNRIRRVKGHTSLDTLLARRVLRRGGIVVTSSDFLGEIADSMGDRMFDELSSPRTEMILMLSPKETIDLENALAAAKSKYVKLIKRLGEEKKAESTSDQSRLDKKAEQDDMRVLEEAIYFDHAFPHMKTKEAQDNSPISYSIESFMEHWKRSAEATQVWNKVKEAQGSAEFEAGLKKAQRDIIDSCSVLAKKLSEGEKEEIGAMLSKATSIKPGKEGEDLLEKWRQQAHRCKMIMSGKENG
jgi:hypothetical protein